MTLVLIVDDVPAVCDQYAHDIARLGGYDTLTATGGKAALRTLELEPVDCVILDLEMPGMDGFDVLKEMRARGLTTPVIVYTGTGNFERCVRAVQLGAASFLDKAESMEKVVHEIAGARERGRLAGEVARLRRRAGEDSPLRGESAAVARLREEIAKLAPIPSPVLVTGESGSGKELVARELHRLGRRPREPFTAVNCAALPENLVESELFGHEAGAFTGADRLRRGAFESAGGGTLFLDEVGELPAPAQAKLLRVLEEGTVRRVGGEREVTVAARVVTATNRDLERAVADGHFREDLLYRLNVHVIATPPLRERLADVPLLAERFLIETAERFGMRPRRLSGEAAVLLRAYSWRRNNVRELRNAVERMTIACDGEEILAEHVPAEIRGEDAAPRATPGVGTFKELKAEAERRILLAALARNDWKISRTAEELGLADHASLLKIMRRHDISRD